MLKEGDEAIVISWIRKVVRAGLHSVSASFIGLCCGMADKMSIKDVHKMLDDINSQEDALNCSLTGKVSGSGSSINPVALYLQA